MGAENKMFFDVFVFTYVFIYVCLCVRVYVRERERWSEVNREKLVVADARYELMSPVCYVAVSSVCCANVLSVDGSGIFDISCYNLDIL